MSEFKKGDEVKVIGHHWQGGREVEFSQSVVGKTGIVGDPRGDAYLNVHVDGESTVFGLLPSDLQHIGDYAEVEVTKQTVICISDGNISVNHTVGSKKGRVSFTGFRQSGHINIENLDKVIAMLQKLKEEV